MKVEVEYAQVALVGIQNLKRRDLAVVERNGHRTECDSEESVCEVEYALANVVQREERTYVLLIERVALLTHLLGVVTPVPRRKVIVPLVLLVVEWHHIGQLLLCTVECRSPDAFE